MQSPAPTTVALPALPPLPQGKGAWRQEHFNALTTWCDDAFQRVPQGEAIYLYFNLQVSDNADDVEKNVLCAYISHSSQAMKVRRDDGQVLSVGTHGSALKVHGCFRKQLATATAANSPSPSMETVERLLKEIELERTESRKRHDEFLETERNRLTSLAAAADAKKDSFAGEDGSHVVCPFGKEWDADDAEKELFLSQAEEHGGSGLLRVARIRRPFTPSPLHPFCSSNRPRAHPPASARDRRRGWPG